MAKKTTVPRRASKKKSAIKRPAKKKVASKTKKPPAARLRKKKTAKKKSTQKRSTARKKKPAKSARPKSLGRPRLPADAKLDQVFQKDYQAREVFDFLGVTTFRELEAYQAAAIVDELTAPMVQTVQRIRKTLAMVNRSLAKDQKFALEFKTKLKSGG